MFLRVVRANVSEGVKREYVRVVEAYRDHDGKTRHRTVINLGRRDLLATHLDLGKLGRLLHGDVVDAGHVAREDVGAIGAWDWGPMLAARAMWSELGLDTILDNLARPDRRAAVRLADRALVLVANRLRRRGASMRWHSGWRTILSAIGAAGASSRPGATKRNARPAGRRGCVLNRGNCSNGIVRSISWWRASSRSNMRCFCGCATCSPCRSTWCSTI